MTKTIGGLNESIIFIGTICSDYDFGRCHAGYRLEPRNGSRF